MTSEPDPGKLEEITGRALGYLTGAAVSALVYLGDRLGLYRTLRRTGPTTSSELATRSRLHERWVREWLHAQASAGLVNYRGDGRFELTGEQAAVLVDEDNPAFLAGGFAATFPLFQRWESLCESFRTGRGVGYEGLGEDYASGTSRFSGPWVRANLVPVIIPGLEGVAAKLAAGAKVADVGCGSGGALLEMAKANPRSDFHGYDSSEVAIGLAKRLIEPTVGNVRFHRATAEELPADGSFDFVLTWDCLHDMTDPAAAMRAIRSAIKPDGTWLIVDVNAKPTPEENYGNPLAAMLYSFSVLDCLAVGTAAEGGAGLGTLGLPEALVRKMTSEAGFSRLSARDFGNPVNAFYEVRP